MADTQRDGRDARTNAGSSERPDRAPAEGADRVPWRVEGARRDGGQTPSQRPRLFGPRFWMVLLGLLVLNWVLSALLVRPPERTEVPYTLFRAQVEAGNVASVTGIEDAIDGQFKNPVRVPVDDQTQEVTRFSTRRPSFAADDNLWELLTEQERGGVGRAAAGPVAAGADPARLRPHPAAGRPVRAAGPAGGGGRGGRGRPRRLWPLPGPPLRARDRPAHHLRGCGRHRRGRGRGGRDRRLPQEPRPLPAAGGHGPQGGAAGRAARDRQDPARPGRGRRGRRAVLLRVGLGVHRVHRGRGRQPRPGPVRDGQDQRPGDHLHRRAGRHRPCPRRVPQRGRPRRARADPKPDPDRDGRLHRHRACDRAGRHQPARDPRPGAAAPGALRPPTHHQPARPGRPPPDPGRARPRGAPGPRCRPGRGRLGHPGHGRGRAGQPGE